MLRHMCVRFLNNKYFIRTVFNTKVNDLSVVPGRMLCIASGQPDTLKPNHNNKILTPHEVHKIENGELEKLLTDPEFRKAYDELTTNIAMTRYVSDEVPSNITTRDMLVLLHMRPSKQKTYLQILYKREQASAMKKALSFPKSANCEQSSLHTYYDGEQVFYGLHKNSMFMRIYNKTMNNFANYKLCYALAFEQPLVVDLSYYNVMTYSENMLLAKQIGIAYGENRHHLKPFNLQLCSFPPESPLMVHIMRNMQNLNHPSLPVVTYPTSLLETYPKEKIVYLSPNAKKIMTSYDPDAIYVIGGIVDKANSVPYTLAKVKKENLEAVKLPLHYLQWSSGNKSLTVDQVVKILLDYRVTNDWDYALKHVPRRKLASAFR